MCQMLDVICHEVQDFILQLILFGSLGVIAYIVARAIPRLDDGENQDIKFVKSFMAYIPTHKLDLALASFLEKTLRKARVAVLRIDNSLMGYLGRVKSNGNGHDKQKSLFNGNGSSGNAENKEVEI